MYDRQAVEPHSNPDELGQRQLLVRHARGEADVFGQFMQLYERRIYAFLWRLGLSANSIDDTFQNALLQLHLKAKLYNPEQALAPWVFTLVLNLVRDERRKHAQPLSALSEIVASRTASPMAGPDQQNEARETAEFLREEVRKLPQEQAEVFSLAASQGLDLQTVAEISGLTLNTVKSHLHRARLSLAQALRRRSSSAARELAS